MRNLRRIAVLLSLLPGELLSAASSHGAPLTLWYEQPAKSGLNEALPIGGGQLGGLIFGVPQQERILLDEDSLWTGNDTTMGAYQLLGDLLINLPQHTNVTQYRRDLNLATATSHVSYESGSVHYSREFFSSHPARVMAARFTADRPGSYSGSVGVLDSHRASAIAGGNRLQITGQLNNGLKYEYQVLVHHEGGSLQTNDATLEFKGCDGLTIMVAAGTDYAMNPSTRYRGEEPHNLVSGALNAASTSSFDSLKAAHIKDYQSLFNRLMVNLGKSSPAQQAQPTDRRKLAAAQTTDPEFEELLFQYGRYLMISSSRPGGLPANLQGIWNENNRPAWNSDYHNNINVQMNYWPAEVANLSECQLPLFDLIESQLPAWRKVTAASAELKTTSGAMTSRGFALRTSHNTMGALDYVWDKTANAWYCLHYWEHYAFTQDRQFLRDRAYPIMKETCEFWEDHLKELPDGRLVVPDGWSPEHGPHEDGVSYNQEIVWDLFNNYVEACDVLGMDHDYRNKILALCDRLATPGVGSWGQLLEWMTEKHDPAFPELDTTNDHHRHTSHLFAVYPGRQITVATSPKLAAAAKVSLDARGPTGDVREWSFAWRTALYARLHEGDSAHQMVQQLFTARNTCLNLFGLHPPMQIDGNFGITAGMAEMLLQSHEGEIHLLPALPKAWPSGSARGLRARGGWEVDLAWQDGALTSVTVRSLTGKSGKLRYNGKSAAFDLPAGTIKQFDASLRPTN